MIKEFVNKFMDNKNELRKKLSEKIIYNYYDIVKYVVETITSENKGPDPERIHEIDDGHYQGTLLYIIGEKAYMPSNYWFVKIDYGSCSGCDTIQGIASGGVYNCPPSESMIDDYMDLALHIVQGLKSMQIDYIDENDS